ncbi:DUF4349 domain-containing protein [Cryptosporangium arvum]|uniref:DUF4349 domain-containing protein n=1 Tax=Cryptosporangium arvum DSM 44712 TaxID=927661 RepID=A0A010ZQH4_9ACTN|nr:DUF4349 domain-containing protein [Cryptosporangium arvum]EXG80929.1 hypothetical protein CryarDRAFT_2024 [Cryptosporangium arvum DSM 44712]
MDVRHRRRLPALAAVLLAGLLLAGCSSSADDGDSSSESGRPQAASAPRSAPDQRSGGTGTGPTQLGTASRPLVYTGTMAVTAGNVPDAARKAIAAAVAAGGYVAADERSVTGPDDDISATLTLKVPSTKFTGTIDALAKLGTETSRNLGTEDQQTASIDIDARIAAQRASVNRVRALLQRATTITELTTIERELTTRESELATSEATKRSLRDQVSYSTITLSLAEPSAPPKPEPKQERGLLVGLENGWSAFVTSVVVLLTIVGWLAPFLIGFAIVGVPIWWALRRYRPRRPAPVSPAPSALHHAHRAPVPPFPPQAPVSAPSSSVPSAPSSPAPPEGPAS